MKKWQRKAAVPKWTIKKPKERKRSLYRGISVYSTNQWRKDRDVFMRKNPLCVWCKRAGLTTAATVCDHVIPIERGGAMWDWRNRQSMCDGCHGIKRSDEGRGIIGEWQLNDKGEKIPKDLI